MLVPMSTGVLRNARLPSKVTARGSGQAIGPAENWQTARLTTSYASCPKCDQAPLPENQAFPAKCPRCGVILARYREREAARRDQADDSGTAVRQSDDSDSAITVRSLLLGTSSGVDAVPLSARAGLLVLIAWWGIRLISLSIVDGKINTSFLHGPLLVFHEAGHVIFRPFGEFLMTLGGTLGQLLMPAILSAALLLRNRDPFGSSIGLWFVGVSLLDVAPYIYDALHPKLMLLTGTTGEDGPHDWIYILDAVGLRNHAQGLGTLVHALGAATIIIALVWGATVLWRQYRALPKLR